MTYNTKNYTEQDGDVTHIGGSLVIDEGGSVQGFPSSSLPIVIANINEQNLCDYTFGEIWNLFNQNNLIVFIKKDEQESSVPGVTDCKTRAFIVSRMEHSGGDNFTLYMLHISDDKQTLIYTCTGQADARPGII